jgi:hypothetical protein
MGPCAAKIKLFQRPEMWQPGGRGSRSDAKKHLQFKYFYRSGEIVASPFGPSRHADAVCRTSKQMGIRHPVARMERSAMRVATPDCGA